MSRKETRHKTRLPWVYIFNIRPDGSKKYFKIFIFEEKWQMYVFYKEYAKISGWKKKTGSHGSEYGLAPCGTYDDKPKFSAIVMPYVMYYVNSRKHKIFKNRIGDILFYKGRLGVGVITHEFGHAAIHHQRIKHGFLKKGLNLGKTNNKLEEAVLYDLASLVRKFTKKCYELRIYK